MVWYSHLIKNCPQFVVIHTVKGFSVVNEAEIDIFLQQFLLSVHNQSCFDFVLFLILIIYNCFFFKLTWKQLRKQQLELDMEKQTGSK